MSSDSSESDDGFATKTKQRNRVEVKVEEVRRLAERREGLEAPVGPDLQIKIRIEEWFG